MQFVTKTRHDNNVIECTYAVYAKNDIELSWPIEKAQSMIKTK